MSAHRDRCTPWTRTCATHHPGRAAEAAPRRWTQFRRGRQVERRRVEGGGRRTRADGQSSPWCQWMWRAPVSAAPTWRGKRLPGTEMSPDKGSWSQEEKWRRDMGGSPRGREEEVVGGKRRGRDNYAAGGEETVLREERRWFCEAIVRSQECDHTCADGAQHARAAISTRGCRRTAQYPGRGPAGWLP